MFGSADDLFTVKTSARPDQVRMTLRGSLDLATTGQLEAAVESARPLSAPLVMDLADVTFVDSTGLRALLAARQHSLSDTGAPLALSRVTPAVRKLLDLSGLGTIFGTEHGAP